MFSQLDKKSRTPQGPCFFWMGSFLFAFLIICGKMKGVIIEGKLAPRIKQEIVGCSVSIC
ncbi:MAG: hypothetical protein AMJ95_00065 [Omnitrophica WOR_2 bacterium SM23_72]|nr:MAG: hypothetical protein AMJ95_00065 [Omnitrophica WOR_2 bacterium SM23_72]